jgi:hypothetical protein
MPANSHRVMMGQWWVVCVLTLLACSSATVEQPEVAVQAQPLAEDAPAAPPANPPAAAGNPPASAQPAPEPAAMAATPPESREEVEARRQAARSADEQDLAGQRKYYRQRRDAEDSSLKLQRTVLRQLESDRRAQANAGAGADTLALVDAELARMRRSISDREARHATFTQKAR